MLQKAIGIILLIVGLLGLSILIYSFSYVQMINEKIDTTVNGLDQLSNNLAILEESQISKAETSIANISLGLSETADFLNKTSTLFEDIGSMNWNIIDPALGEYFTATGESLQSTGNRMHLASSDINETSVSIAQIRNMLSYSQFLLSSASEDLKMAKILIILVVSIFALIFCGFIITGIGFIFIKPAKKVGQEEDQYEKLKRKWGG